MIFTKFLLIICIFLKMLFLLYLIFYALLFRFNYKSLRQFCISFLKDRITFMKYYKSKFSIYYIVTIILFIISKNILHYSNNNNKIGIQIQIIFSYWTKYCEIFIKTIKLATVILNSTHVPFLNTIFSTIVNLSNNNISKYYE